VNALRNADRLPLQAAMPIDGTDAAAGPEKVISVPRTHI
jgi:hypothetical protein